MKNNRNKGSLSLQGGKAQGPRVNGIDPGQEFNYRFSFPGSRVFFKLRHDFQFITGLGLIIFILVVCSVAAPYLAPSDPDKQFDEGLTAVGEPIPPNAKFVLGTDPLGRDLLSRVLYGGQVSLIIAVTVNLIVLAVGTIIGLLAGYFQGLTDFILSRVVETMQAFPVILFAVALSTALRPGIIVAIAALSLVGWASVARIVRGQVLGLRQLDYIEAARAVGSRNSRILIRHLLPHLISPLLVLMSLTIPTTILLEAALSYLGAGVPPNVPSWGNIIQEGTPYYRTAPWIVIFPGLAIFLTVLGFNLVGNGLRDSLDPRHQRV